MNQKFRKDSGWGDPTAGLVPSEGSFLFVSGPGLGLSLLDDSVTNSIFSSSVVLYQGHF